MFKKEDKSRNKGIPTLNVEEGENTRYTLHALDLAMLPKIDLTDPEKVAERTKTYFQMCIQNDMKPTMAGYALALDVDRMVLQKIIYGAKDIGDVSREIVIKAYRMLTAQMEDYMSNGKINPVAGIYLMKNNMNYSDRENVMPEFEAEKQVTVEELITTARALGIEKKKK